jgi:hypothetical protein
LLLQVICQLQQGITDLTGVRHAEAYPTNLLAEVDDHVLTNDTRRYLKHPLVPIVELALGVLFRI